MKLRNKTIHPMDEVEREKRLAELKDEQFVRRMQTTVWAARKTVRWAVIGAAGALVYSKMSKKNEDHNEDN